MLSNILLHELDKYLESKGQKFVRYADDFSIYCKSKGKARKIGNGVYLFLKNKLKLPINKEMPENESSKGTHVVLESVNLTIFRYWDMALQAALRREVRANTS